MDRRKTVMFIQENIQASLNKRQTMKLKSNKSDDSSSDSEYISDDWFSIVILIIKTMKYFLQHRGPQYIFCLILAAYFIGQLIFRL